MPVVLLTPIQSVVKKQSVPSGHPTGPPPSTAARQVSPSGRQIPGPSHDGPHSPSRRGSATHDSMRSSQSSIMRQPPQSV